MARERRRDSDSSHVERTVAGSIREIPRSGAGVVEGGGEEKGVRG